MRMATVFVSPGRHEVIVDLRAFSVVKTMLCEPDATMTPRRGVAPRLRPSRVTRELGMVLMLSLLDSSTAQ